DEYRVALTPAGARGLIQRGDEGLVEATAGDGSAFGAEQYERAGARPVSVDEAWGDADPLLQVKEPTLPRQPRAPERLILLSYRAIAPDEPPTGAPVDSGITGVAYEPVETDDHRLPLLAPMSEIAGRLAPQAAAHFLEKPLGGRGVLLAGTPGVQPGHVVVL